MRDYRLYFIDHNGHILGPAVEFACANDVEAIAKAEEVADGQSVELWQLSRKLFTKITKPLPRSKSNKR